MALQSGEFARPGVLGTTEVPTYRPPWDAVKLWEGIEARSETPATGTASGLLGAGKASQESSLSIQLNSVLTLTTQG